MAVDAQTQAVAALINKLERGERLTDAEERQVFDLARSSGYQSRVLPLSTQDDRNQAASLLRDAYITPPAEPIAPVGADPDDPSLPEPGVSPDNPIRRTTGRAAADAARVTTAETARSGLNVQETPAEIYNAALALTQRLTAVSDDELRQAGVDNPRQVRLDAANLLSLAATGQENLVQDGNRVALAAIYADVGGQIETVLANVAGTGDRSADLRADLGVREEFDVAAEDRAVEAQIAAEERQLGRQLNAEERATIRDQAAFDRSVEAQIEAEERQLGRQLSAEERAERYRMAGEQRGEQRQIRAEERGETRDETAFQRSVEAQIAGEERQLGRQLSAEERAERHRVAAEQRSEAAQIRAEDRQNAEFDRRQSEALEAARIDEQEDLRETAVSTAIQVFQQRINNLPARERAALLADQSRVRNTAYVMTQSSFSALGITPTLADFRTVMGFLVPEVVTTPTFQADLEATYVQDYGEAATSTVAGGGPPSTAVVPESIIGPDGEPLPAQSVGGTGTGGTPFETSGGTSFFDGQGSSSPISTIGSSVAAQVQTGNLNVEDALNILDGSVTALLTSVEIDSKGRIGMEFASFANSLATAVASDPAYTIAHALDDIRLYGQGLTDQRDRNQAERERAFARAGQRRQDIQDYRITAEEIRERDRTRRDRLRGELTDLDVETGRRQDSFLRDILSQRSTGGGLPGATRGVDPALRLAGNLGQRAGIDPGALVESGGPIRSPDYASAFATARARLRGELDTPGPNIEEILGAEPTALPEVEL